LGRDAVSATPRSSDHGHDAVLVEAFRQRRQRQYHDNAGWFGWCSKSAFAARYDDSHHRLAHTGGLNGCQHVGSQLIDVPGNREFEVGRGLQEATQMGCESAWVTMITSQSLEDGVAI